MGYFANQQLALVELPYRPPVSDQNDYHLAMLILLPTAPEGLSALEAQLTFDNLRSWCRAMQPTAVQLFVPKFTIQRHFTFNPYLQQLGMAEAFSSTADFSGINGRRDLSLSRVVQASFISVNEKGTEAAAVSASTLHVKALPPRKPTQVFRADHPFIFIVWDKMSHQLLFMGRFSPIKSTS